MDDYFFTVVVGDGAVEFQHFAFAHKSFFGRNDPDDFGYTQNGVGHAVAESILFADTFFAIGFTEVLENPLLLRFYKIFQMARIVANGHDHLQPILDADFQLDAAGEVARDMGIGNRAAAQSQHCRGFEADFFAFGKHGLIIQLARRRARILKSC